MGTNATALFVLTPLHDILTTSKFVITLISSMTLFGFPSNKAATVSIAVNVLCTFGQDHVVVTNDFHTIEGL